MHLHWFILRTMQVSKIWKACLLTRILIHLQVCSTQYKCTRTQVTRNRRFEEKVTIARVAWLFFCSLLLPRAAEQDKGNAKQLKGLFFLRVSLTNTHAHVASSYAGKSASNKKWAVLVYLCLRLSYSWMMRCACFCGSNCCKDWLKYNTVYTTYCPAGTMYLPTVNNHF